ncbi:unannotated protein [freshwater metagenome]|uniref:Unannotated protein n=1 Tax=freshwater metagenome TaxID=449393 RepID=A0A6J6IS10_9ZZZZ
MKLCPLKHENTDDSKFCETCGTRILDPLPPTSSVPEPPVVDEVTPAGGVPQPTTLDLDSMTDEADDSTEDDIKDVDIVLTDDTSIAAAPNADDADDADADKDDASDDDDDNSVTSDADDASNDDDSDDTSDDDDDDSSAQPVATYLTTSAPAVTTAVAEMNNWAQQWDVTTDPFVKGLNEAIQQNSDLGMWSSLDPTQLLPDMPDQTTIFHRIGSGLALLRNVLVFLPVAITWQAIAKATEAYSTWNGEAPDTGQGEVLQKNFLDFWANGYGILDNKYTLPHIGILDFWIIIAIIVISLTASGLTARGDKANESLRQIFESERLTIAIRIRRALHGKREASPESIATSLADALADLNQTTRDMAEVAARLEATTTGVMALTPQIERLNDHAGTFAVQTSTAIAQAVQQLVASVDSLNGSVSNNITNAFQTAVSSLQEVGEEMKRHATSVEYGTKLLKDDIEAIRKGLRR